MYEALCCVSVVSACADVLVCALLDSVARYYCMCGFMAPVCSLCGCMSLLVLMMTLWCLEFELRPALVHFLRSLAQDLWLVG